LINIVIAAIRTRHRKTKGQNHYFRLGGVATINGYKLIQKVMFDAYLAKKTIDSHAAEHYQWPATHCMPMQPRGAMFVAPTTERA